MSNLNDFISGTVTTLDFWRHDGISASTSHGAYDVNQNVQVLGTTSDTHFIGREFKLWHVPDRRIFFEHPSYGGTPLRVILNMSADKTNAPNPAQAVNHEDNLLPTLQAVMECLTYNVYTKKSEGDAYVLKGSTDFSTLSEPLLWQNLQPDEYASLIGSDIFLRMRFQPSESDYTIDWQGVNSTRDVGTLLPYINGKENIEECFIKTEDEGQIFVKIGWGLNNTAWNNLFSRSYNEIEGILFSDYHVLDTIYSGQKAIHLS